MFGLTADDLMGLDDQPEPADDEGPSDDEINAAIGDLLADLRGKVELIDATDDRDAKRRQIAALTRRIEVHTEAVGRTVRGRLRKRTSVYVLLALTDDATIDSTMRRTGLGNISLEALTAEVEVPL